MRKDFIFLLIVAVFLVFAFTPTALVVSCGEEVVNAEMGAVETQVTVLKEPCSLLVDIELSDATAVSRQDDCECHPTMYARNDNPNPEICIERSYIYDVSSRTTTGNVRNTGHPAS